MCLRMSVSVCTHVCIGGCAPARTAGRNELPTTQSEQLSFPIPILVLHKRICQKGSTLYKYTKMKSTGLAWE